MSRYDWPRAPGADRARQGGDDPGGRARHNARRHRGLRTEPGLAASRAARAPTHAPGAAPASRAPADGRTHLWQPLGPACVLGGQAEGRPRVSGRVNAIVVHDGGQRAYAASANGGVWYSKDGGASWVSVGGLAATNTAGILRPAQRNACGALHVEFGAAEGDDVVFLGTGEVTHPMTGEPGFSEGGIGILVADRPMKSALPDPWVREAPNLANNGVYRIVREPGGTTVVAATRTGLYERPATAGADAIWVHPAAPPFDTLEVDCTDLAWTPAHAGRPARLWAWVKSGPSAGLYVRDAGAAAFVKVVVDAASPYAYTASRAVLAASTPPTQVWVLNDRGAGTVPALFRVENTVSGPTRPTAMGVVGVPDILRDSGFYNVAIAVDPASPDRVALAGSYLGDPNVAADLLLVTTEDGATRGYDASIVVAEVAPDPANGGRLTYGLAATPFRMIGVGVHPDVHALAYTNGGATLWAGCDGGIFRSDAPQRPAGFFARNQGLSISESNFVANHPTCEGHLVAGLQDNGVVVRQSSGVWTIRFLGDGGGVVMDPARPDRFLAQYVCGSWNREPAGGTGPLVRGATIAAGERDDSAFYSVPASIAHVRTQPPAAPVQFSQTLVGTTRLWYTDDFGSTWVTLPTGTDPLAAPPRPAQDSLGEPILACRWQDPDTAWILTPAAVYRYRRTAGSHNAGGPGAWARPMEAVLRRSAKNKKDGSSATGPIRKSPTWTELAVNVLPPPGGEPPIGALYLGTVGHPEDAEVDTLWWFDGKDRWFKTGLRAGAVPAPVTAVLVDPAFPAEVWVGTTVGVWMGTRSRVGNADPTWTWEQRVNGLPEAAVEDLALFSQPGLRLIRAAIAARGVWELRLDVADLAECTYVRVHDDDLRHRLPTVCVQRDGTTPRSWHGSPDVRPRVAPAKVNAPTTLPWRRRTFPGSTEQLRRFQAALRSSVLAVTGKLDPRIVANGKWDAYFSEVLRDHTAPTVAVAAAPPLPALNEVELTKAFWDQHMKAPHATAEPWGAGPPTEADLHELTPSLPEGDRSSTSCSLPPGPCKVDVVVHHRGLHTRPGADVRVTLLKWVDPKKKGRSPFTDSTRWYGAPVPWTAAVNQVLNSPTGAAPGPLSEGWSFVGNTDAKRRVTLTGQTLDPLTAGVATFDLDLTGVKQDTVVLLVAVIRAGSGPAADIALGPSRLEDLALNSPQVAVRSVRVKRP